MSFTKFILSRKFLTHLLVAALLFLVLIILTIQGLKIYTRHNQSFPVPDFSGLKPAEAIQIAKQHDLRVQIVDSIFMDDAPPGVIVDQVPGAGHGVKQNRTISLTINSTNPEMVTLPQLTDISIRQAQALIENSGLQIGNISYRPSEYKNLVLEVQLDSTGLSTGQKLTKGTKIDLIVGRELGDQVTSLPNLAGLTVDEAKKILADAMLNTGVIIYDQSIVTAEDSLSAQIWRQRPDPKVTTKVPPGTSVDMWVTVDSLKIGFILDPLFE